MHCRVVGLHNGPTEKGREGECKDTVCERFGYQLANVSSAEWKTVTERVTRRITSWGNIGRLRCDTPPMSLQIKIISNGQSTTCLRALQLRVDNDINETH